MIVLENSVIIISNYYNLKYIVISNDLSQMVNFPTLIPGCDSHRPTHADLFLFSDASICSKMALPPLRNSDCLNFHWLFIKLKTRCPISLYSLWLFSCWLGWSSWSFERFERCSRGGYLQLSASAIASEICQWVQVGIVVYIPYHIYVVKPHSPPWFSAACAATIVHRSYFFACTKSKVQKAGNQYKRVLEAAKLAYANKTRVHHFPESRF